MLPMVILEGQDAVHHWTRRWGEPGRPAVLETLCGAGPAGRRTGVVRLAGRPHAPRGPRSALRAGVGFVPGPPPGSSAAHASGPRSVSRSPRWRSGRRPGTRRSARSPAATSRRWSSPGRSSTCPWLLLLDEPTRGVDVGAKAEIYRLLRRLADDGTGILLASSELPELTGVCDRIVVLRRGRTVADLAADGCTGEDILTAAMDGAYAGKDDHCPS